MRNLLIFLSLLLAFQLPSLSLMNAQEKGDNRSPTRKAKQRASSDALHIILDLANPSHSYAVMKKAGTDTGKQMPVGFGRSGVSAAGKSFTAGYTMLGQFRINAILSPTHFEMEDALIAESGKSKEWLAANLFANMSRIDFDGDGQGSEYGDGFFGLAPLYSETSQPFHFGKYKNVFRWYSFAIHGTQNESRIGQSITGGCVNIGKDNLQHLLEHLQLGDVVRISLATKTIR